MSELSNDTLLTKPTQKLSINSSNFNSHSSQSTAETPPKAPKKFDNLPYSGPSYSSIYANINKGCLNTGLLMAGNKKESALLVSSDPNDATKTGTFIHEPTVENKYHFKQILTHNSENGKRPRELILMVMAIFFFLMSIILAIVLLNYHLSVKDGASSTDSNSINSISDGGGGASSSSSSERFCLSHTCMKVAAEMKEFLSEDIDPCSNFYKYSCGEWQSEATIPATRPSWSRIDAMTMKSYETLKDVLETPDQSKFVPSYHTKMRRFFESCLTRGMGVDACSSSSNKDNNPVSRLRQISSAGNWQKIFQNIQIDLNVPLFFQMWKDRSPSDPNSTMLYLDEFKEDTLPLHRDFLLDSEIETRDLKNYAAELVREANFPDEMVESVSNDAAFILKQLRSNSLRDDDPKKKYPLLRAEIITVGKLTQEAMNQFDFQTILGYLMYRNNSRLSEETEILVSNVDYFRNLARLNLNTKQSKLQNFVTFLVLHKFSQFVSEKFATKRDQYVWRHTNRQHALEAWEHCLLASSPEGLSALSSLNMKHKPVESQIHSILFTYLQSVYQDYLHTLNISQSVLSSITNKIDRMSLAVRNDIHDDAGKMDDYFESWAMKGENLTALDAMISYASFESYSSSRSDLLDPGFSSQPQLSRYSIVSNEIKLSSILFQWPFYIPDNTMPRYMEFALIGFWISRSMAESLGFYASHFDSKGRLMTENFDLRSNKLVQCATNVLLKNKQINTELALEETINTIVSVEMAFRAFSKYHRENPSSSRVLPAVNRNPQQLFFMGLAQSLCEVQHAANIEANHFRGKLIFEDFVRLSSGTLNSFRTTFQCSKTENITDCF